MGITESIDIIKDYMAANLPAKLSAAGVDDFDKYIGDIPDESEKKILAVYMDRDEADNTNNDFNVIIQAQLYSVLSRTSWKYQDAIKECIKSLGAVAVGYSSLERIASENYPIFDNDSTIIIFEVRYQNYEDDCTILED